MLDLRGNVPASVRPVGRAGVRTHQTLIALLGALIIVWLALRSWKIVAAVFFSLMVGLATTAALGVAMVGAFNVISIAFFVLFV